MIIFNFIVNMTFGEVEMKTYSLALSIYLSLAFSHSRLFGVSFIYVLKCWFGSWILCGYVALGVTSKQTAVFAVAHIERFQVGTSPQRCLFSLVFSLFGASLGWSVCDSTRRK